jgi:fumarate reductase flavoprotein subunit
MTDYDRARPDLFVRSGSAKALAERLGMDPAVLQQSIVSSTLTAPYIVMGPVISSVTTTEGGLSIDRHGAVRKADGGRIAGLYAAGAVAQSGMRLHGHGLHIAWAVVSGRAAGRSAAQL